MGKQRRTFRDAVLRALERADRPLSALELTHLLRSRGFPVPPSQVFRAIRELVDRGAVRKILVAGGYLPATANALALFCRECGKVTDTPCPAAFDGLEREATAKGFSISRPMVEVSGVCAECGDAARPPSSRARPPGTRRIRRRTSG